ncbi:MAG: LLM class flavin-dependent oxidoreductase, partial [Chloroflexota bacterium]|nr:LLM class flavin-dependent oxidoreductase [Chloroflexota bacterium]
TEPSFSYEGRYHSFRDVSVTPKPYQQPHPPIRIAATTPDTFPALGTQGYPVFGAVRQGTFSELAPDLDAYRTAYRTAGHPGQGQVFLRVPIYVADTEEQALSEPEPSMMQFYRAMANQLIESARDPGARPTERRAERGEALAKLTFEQARREKVVVGTPAMVADRLAELRDELGLSGILAELNCGGQIPQERVMRSLQLLCTEVMPGFK